MMSPDCPPCWPGATQVGEAAGRRGLRLLLVFAAHVGVLWAGMELSARPELAAPTRTMSVRLLEQAPLPPAVAPAPPRPPKSRLTDRREAPSPPVVAVAPATAAPEARFSVAPPPAPAVTKDAVAAPAPPPLPVTAVRFDADYLSNPKPAYPPASRRLGEEGRVLLRVHVSAEGLPLVVEIRQSCGFPRLDESAQAAVTRWRFVPARRGDEAIDAWVAVPIVFSLQSS
jgi:protein TonB